MGAAAPEFTPVNQRDAAPGAAEKKSTRRSDYTAPHDDHTFGCCGCCHDPLTLSAVAAFARMRVNGQNPSPRMAPRER
jgi:hypothetical protein